ncbi:CHAP domain-containing protein [Homoserinibacter sp. GY 40078]|uniref:CHAP domain-containing protein n=1 Tax=Homoserinibacter sp. GY 40078 TaxID=2603275 RepID=UPI002105C208|nr:CHAP domain-containing protein [Homoserinibacter sp. GY 40078]
MVATATLIPAAPAAAYNGYCVNSECNALYNDTYSIWQDNWEPTPGRGWWGTTAGHNCTNYVAWRLTRDGVPAKSGLGNAKDWDNNLGASGHVYSQSASANHVVVGAVAQWNETSVPPKGHVAYIQEVVANSYIVLWEDGTGGNFRIKKVLWNSSGWPDNILHFNGSEPAPPPGFEEEEEEAPSNEMVLADWRLNNANDSSSADLSYSHGLPGDVPLMGDWDGDGIDTEGVFRNGRWILTNVQGGGASFQSYIFGNGSDTPLVGDWDGDGIDTPALWREGKWYISNEFGASAPYTIHVYGKKTDKPVVGDWDGDGVDSFGVVRKDIWILTDTQSSDQAYDGFLYGKPGDIPVAGDWDGDGVDTIGVKRDDKWILTNTWSSAQSWPFLYGRDHDIPLVGDWDGNGTDTIGIAR